MSWKVKKLSEVAEIIMGQAPIGESYNTDGVGLPLVAGAADLGDVNPVCKKFTSQPSKVSKSGDIIMCIRATIGDLNWANDKYALGRGVAGIRVKPEANSKYLWYWLLANKAYFLEQGRGATFLQISRKDLDNAEIPLPPLEEQKRIAEVLDKADRLRQKDRQLLAKYDQLLQSVFLNMFGDANPETASWRTVTIKDIAASDKGSMRTGPFGSDLLHSEFVDEGVFVLGIDNVVNNTFEWGKARFISEQKYEKLKRYKVYPGDVLISIMATTGRTAVVPDNMPEAINSKHLAAITLNRKLADPTFISYSLHKDPKVVFQLTAQNRGAIMNGLNLGIIKETKINLPPLHLQKKFASIVNQIEKLKGNSAEGINKSETLFQSLLQKAFKGELALQEAKAVV